MQLVVLAFIALAAWWCWTSTASAQPSAAAPDGPGNTGLVDVEPLTQVLTATLRLLPATTLAVVGGDPIGDVLHHVAAPLPGAVEGTAGPRPAVVGDVVEPPHDVDAALRALTPAAPEPTPLAAPPAPDPALIPTSKAPAGRPFMRTVTARRAPRSPMVVQAAGPWWHDERAWAPETAAAPPALASTPAAGNTTTVLRAAARPSTGDDGPGHEPGNHSSRRPPAPLAPAGSGSTAGAGTGDGGQRTDRGPLMSGTPGARAAFDAVSTAALVSAAVEAPEDGPASLPPTTPD